MEKPDSCKGKALMNLRIDENLRNEFKEKAERESTTMSKVLITYINRYVKNQRGK